MPNAITTTASGTLRATSNPDQGKSGASAHLAAIQLSGGSLNLNPHGHLLICPAGSWLFPGRIAGKPLTRVAVSKAMTAAARQAELDLRVYAYPYTWEWVNDGECHRNGKVSTATCDN